MCHEPRLLQKSHDVFSPTSSLQYHYKGSTVTGKLHKRSPNGTEAKPVWIVTPSDRRRKNEDIPEKALGKIINAQEAMSNRGPKLKKGSRITRDSSSPTLDTSNSDGDGSLEDEHGHKRGSGNGSPSEECSRAGGGSPTRKRKSDDSNTSGERANASRKTVKFSQESNDSTAALKKTIKKSKRSKNALTRIGTRSTRGSGEAVLLPELPTRKKNLFKEKKIKKDENVKVVKMLTGTLYLYRGDRPRAEFVRFK
mmetsp:Transcript_30391/g.55808  ORF Transcript_30391/g.55808 Transcript_30391/m.55808 type:complete len:253 (+) Transcript_30391:36-794(+)|eukprot:CAMPEP_0201630984 /NCGR_PEP_ID=MMETSP0493-20130528/5131_1 /ASSEMBLY_ACC=CAM_ASM_000838 /TAXON_ID=420259 /ORGANISM="Thalassiosira gravida, Strain GMp14c1" /LENGTH=252 /DNA_ID=CAMNT_0048102251 /DNA_START=1 /DNA_END=759 /DNA_ORIENTATION=+